MLYKVMAYCCLSTKKSLMQHWSLHDLYSQT